MPNAADMELPTTGCRESKVSGFGCGSSFALSSVTASAGSSSTSIASSTSSFACSARSASEDLTRCWSLLLNSVVDENTMVPSALRPSASISKASSGCSGFSLVSTCMSGWTFTSTGGAAARCARSRLSFSSISSSPSSAASDEAGGAGSGFATLLAESCSSSSSSSLLRFFRLTFFSFFSFFSFFFDRLGFLKASISCWV
mmetsp:Transcript_8388/g.31582  ORF Transcript_8388/g.31582 Transcript_8388/m.31582 type:complete len:201 (+) Transcript_8388:452-1054(+)